MGNQIFFSIVIPFTCHATEYIIKPYNEYNPNIIGRFIRFKPQVLYFVLDSSPPGFLKRNNGINRLLATVEDADGNNIHEKEPIKENMIFEVLSIFKSIEIKPKPAKWSEKEWQDYLNWRKSKKWFGVEYVLKDENGVISTIGHGGLSYSYDVTNNRDLIIKSYNSKITKKIRDMLVKQIKSHGIDKQKDINKILQETIPIIINKNMIVVNKIIKPCSQEITTFCGNVHNGFVLIDCLKQNIKHENSICSKAIINAIGE